jgi:tetrapyrrole methylase family protein / MazG family protein
MCLPHDESGRREFGEALKSNPDFTNLLKLIDALLGDGGCPWDQSRKLEDCPKYLSGELDEVVEAIRSGDNSNLEEELGDLLFMAAFTIKVAEKERKVEISRLLKRIIDKMVFRHPHVFGGEMSAGTPDEVVSNWAKLKSQEKEKSSGQDENNRPDPGIT